MKHPLKTLLAAAALALSLQPAVQAQEFKQGIRLVVPYGAGGSTDVMARAVSQTIARELGQPVVVDNKPGANGQIGSQFVKSAPSDGSTFLFTLDHSVIIVPQITPAVPYTARDFLPVGTAGRFQWVLVTPLSGPAKSLPEFVEAAKKDPALRNYGVPIVGGVPQVMGEALARKVDAPLTVVPFAGAAPLMPQLMGGQLSAGIVGVGEALSMSKSGKVRLLGISGNKRSAILPDVPTFEEMGLPGVSLGTYYTVYAPKDLPKSMAERFNKALRLAIADPAVEKRAQEMSIELYSPGFDDTQREMAAVATFWQRALKAPQ